MLTDGRRTDAGVTGILIAHLRAFGSGELMREVKINKNFQRKIANIFLPIFLAYVLGAQKNCLDEMILLSTHNICFG